MVTSHMQSGEIIKGLLYCAGVPYLLRDGKQVKRWSGDCLRLAQYSTFWILLLLRL